MYFPRSPILGVLSTLLFLTACKDPPDSAPPPPEVHIFEIVPESLVIRDDYTGRTAGFREVDIRAQVGGIILKRTYVEGSLVRQGEVLFRLDPAPFNAALAQARASLEDGKARFKQAERNWNRVRVLFKQNVVSTKERDEALSQFEQARADVEQGRAKVKTALINLAYTTVRAPITGIAGQAVKSDGNLIGTSPADNLLTQMTQIDPVYVYFAYPDADFLSQKNLMEKGKLESPGGQPLQITLKLADGSAYLEKGYVDFTDATINTKTGSVHARALIPNPNARLLPGQFVKVTVQGLVRKNAVIIPEKAIMQGPQGPFVYKLGPENKALVQPITLGKRTPKGPLIEEGLEAGDMIITEGMIKVRPQSPVTLSPKQEDVIPPSNQVPPSPQIPLSSQNKS